MNGVMQLSTDTTCQFPLCKDHAVRDGYCVSHAKYFAGPECTKKTKKPIAFQSKKRAQARVERKKMLVKKVEEDPWCRIKSPVCTGLAQCGNHIQKSSPANYGVKENNEPCCLACNGWIENNVAFAVKNGHQVSRFKKAI